MPHLVGHPLLSKHALAYSLVALNSKEDKERCIYFCGNSLGLQPRRTSERIASHLTSWAKKGVYGHFKGHEDTSLPPYLHVDDVAAKLIAPILGALPAEVAVMETLTANLHILLASFYQPRNGRNKIIIEGKAFPSDHVSMRDIILVVEGPYFWLLSVRC